MISIRAVAKRGNFTLDVDVSLAPGITGLVGPSGAGKSSLLLSIAGLLPSQGLISIAGQPISNLAVHQRHVGLVFQDDLLFPHLSVEANLRYGMPAKERLSLERVAASLGIGNLLSRRPATLSGGERQRVALARTLLSQPRLLLCDEPLSSLDHTAKREILCFLSAICHELDLPMLYVSHDLGEVLTLTDRLVVLAQGRIAGQGSFNELRADARIRPLLYDEELARRIGAVG